jgi:hypothetical protein
VQRSKLRGGCAPRGTISRSSLLLDSAFERRRSWELCNRHSHSIAAQWCSRICRAGSWRAGWRLQPNNRRSSISHHFTSNLPFGSHSIASVEGSTLKNVKNKNRRWLPRWIGTDALSTSLPHHVEAQARHTVLWLHLRHQSYVVCPSHIGLFTQFYPSSTAANGSWTSRPPIFDAPSPRPLCIRHHQRAAHSHRHEP